MGHVEAGRTPFWPYVPLVMNPHLRRPDRRDWWKRKNDPPPPEVVTVPSVSALLGFLAGGAGTEPRKRKNPLAKGVVRTKAIGSRA